MDAAGRGLRGMPPVECHYLLLLYCVFPKPSLEWIFAMQPVDSEYPWHPAVRQYLENSGGMPARVERLPGGLSTAGIERLHWFDRSLILKRGVKPAELY